MKYRIMLEKRLSGEIELIDLFLEYEGKLYRTVRAVPQLNPMPEKVIVGELFREMGDFLLREGNDETNNV